MRTFFIGWRRKAGCVALVMALILFVSWMRSFFVRDIIILANRNDMHLLASSLGMVGWLRHPNTQGPGIEWKSSGEKPHLLFGRYVLGDEGSWKAPYSLLVLPLTVLSACLILWKHQVPKSADS